MDTRRSNRPKDGLLPAGVVPAGSAGEDEGSETRVVKLSGIQAVGPSRSRTAPAILVAFIAVAVVSFGIGAGLRPSSASPSAAATQPAGALASPTTEASVRPAISTPSVAPPTPSTPTPRPTIAPPWAWTRHPFLPNESVRLDGGTGAWAVGSNVLALTERVFPNGELAAYTIARLVPGFDWRLADMPRSVDGVYGGTVLDGRLWFVTRITGLADVTWQLVSTTDGTTFESPGPAIGLGALDGISFLGKVGDRWVAAGWLYTDVGEGSEVSFLRSSEDGVVWEDATLPDATGDLASVTGASSGKLGVVVAYEGGESVGNGIVITSRDGMTWARTTFHDPLFEPSVASCDPDICVLAGYANDSDPAPVAWWSEGGRTWTASATNAWIDGEYHGVGTLVQYDGGLLATSGVGPWIWLSADGKTWRPVAVLPRASEDPEHPGTGVQLAGVAIAGDLVIALNPPFEDAAPTYWRGSLAAMLAAP